MMDDDERKPGPVERALANAVQAAEHIPATFFPAMVFGIGRTIDDGLAAVREEVQKLRPDSGAWVVTQRPGGPILTLRNGWQNTDETHPEEWAWFDTRADAVTALVLIGGLDEKKVRIVRCHRGTRWITAE